MTIITVLDSSLEGFEVLAEHLEATPVANLSKRLPKETLVLLPSTAPGLVASARAFGAYRIALYHAEGPVRVGLSRVALRAAMSFVDLTIVPNEQSERSAVRLGADPERIARTTDGVLDRLRSEPQRRTLPKGCAEAGVSLALDAADKLGVLGLLERVTPSRGVNVVNYHRILPLQELVLYGRPQMAMGAPVFEAQLDTMAQLRGFAPIELLRSEAADGRVAITFDDGYEDNFRVAFPLLERFSAPACIFLATNLIGRPDALWWDRLSLSLYTYWRTGDWRAGARKPLPKAIPSRAEALHETAALEKARSIITSVLSDLNDTDEASRQAAVEAAVGLIPKLEAQRTMLSWDEVKAMSEAGISFGSHTRNHVPLDELSKDNAMEELFGGQSDLEAQVGQMRPKFTALPRGRLGEVSEEDLRAGFDGVMTTDAGVNPTNCESLYFKRRDGRMLTLSGRHHPAKLRLELTGLVDKLRDYVNRTS